jgi:hypothetical protein
MPSERLIRRAMQTVQTLNPPEQINTLQRASRALDNKGNVILKPQHFIRMIDDATGDIYRVKVINGVLTPVLES